MEYLAARGKGRPGSTPGSIDYRLTRRRVLRSYRDGDIASSEICDAQAELLRVGASCSEPAGEACPVCREQDLRIVRFVFGPRLPKSGRAVSSAGELTRLAGRAGEHRCYEVEVCLQCRWNHLRASFPLVAERSA